MRRSLLALGAAMVLLAGACGSTHHTSAPPTTPVPTAPLPSSTTTRPPSTTSPSTTNPTRTLPASTTTVPDTSIVPRHITVAYVDAVLAKLNHVYGDAVRSTVAHKQLTVAAYKDLAAIYTPSLAAEEKKAFIETVNGSLKNIRKVPGDPIMRVTRMIHASDSCIYAKVDTNSSPEVVHPVPRLADEFIGLRPRQAGPSIDPTRWLFFADIVTKTAATVPDQC